ncbi:MAG: hypothetical protein EXS46_01560 [Candidatus Taylorbacteria bacterium]|nr:hypothetical protein [Candidatus Taylorbacteria bacterium]
MDLLAMIVPHIRAAGTEECKHYLRGENRPQIPQRLKQTFALPGAIPVTAVPVETTGFPIEETDCIQWFDHMERFTKEHFGTEIILRDKFPLPARLPWKHVLPIFDPGFTNRDMVDKALKSRGLSVYEGTDVMKYCGSGTFDTPRLYLVERSITPTPATMGLPPKFAKHWFAGRQTHPLHLRGYGIGTSLWRGVEEQLLDSGPTRTWFPENALPDGRVAYGFFSPTYGDVWFRDYDAGHEADDMAFREAIVLSLKP